MGLLHDLRRDAVRHAFAYPTDTSVTLPADLGLELMGKFVGGDKDLADKGLLAAKILKDRTLRGQADRLAGPIDGGIAVVPSATDQRLDEGFLVGGNHEPDIMVQRQPVGIVKKIQTCLNGPLDRLERRLIDVRIVHNGHGAGQGRNDADRSQPQADGHPPKEDAQGAPGETPALPPAAKSCARGAAIIHGVSPGAFACRRSVPNETQRCAILANQPRQSNGRFSGKDAEDSFPLGASLETFVTRCPWDEVQNGMTRRLAGVSQARSNDTVQLLRASLP